METQAAYALASEIEWINASARVAMTPLRRGQKRRDRIAHEYDPLAATCLAELILSRVNTGQTQ